MYYILFAYGPSSNGKKTLILKMAKIFLLLKFVHVFNEKMLVIPDIYAIKNYTQTQMYVNTFL